MSKILHEYIQYEIDKYPQVCGECPFLHPYYSYRGYLYYDCNLGYIDNVRSRDFNVGTRRWGFCDIEDNPNIFVQSEKDNTNA